MTTQNNNKEYFYRIEPYMGMYVRAEIFYKSRTDGTEILINVKEFKKGFLVWTSYENRHFKEAKKWVDNEMLQIFIANK